MSIVNVMFVGFPEVLLSTVFMFIVTNGTKEFVRNILSNVVKSMISTIFILSFIYLIRYNVSGVVGITFLNTIVYSVCMFLFWKFNIRQSLICGSLAVFVIIISEIITVAPTVSIIVENILKYDFISAKIIWSLPTRIIQMLIISIITIKNLSLKDNTLLVTSWKQFSNGQKFTSVFSIALVFISIIFSTNYSDFYVKMKINNINVSLFSSSMFMILIQSIIYLFTTLLLLNRTSKYEDYKNILHRNPSEIIDILNNLKGGENNE